MDKEKDKNKDAALLYSLYFVYEIIGKLERDLYKSKIYDAFVSST